MLTSTPEDFEKNKKKLLWNHFRAVYYNLVVYPYHYNSRDLWL